MPEKMLVRTLNGGRPQPKMSRFKLDIPSPVNEMSAAYRAEEMKREEKAWRRKSFYLVIDL